MGKMAGLGVDKVTLLVGPSVDSVAQRERNAHVRELRSSTTEAVEEVTLDNASERVLLERRKGWSAKNIHTVRLNALLDRTAEVTPPADLVSILQVLTHLWPVGIPL